MVVGLDVFTEHFKTHTDHYVLIGGGACDWYMERKGIPFRVTKDLDIILIVEVLSPEFINHFWDFIKAGEYAISEKGNKRNFYRFIKPGVEGYPKMIELFARKPDLIKEVEGMHLTDIPTGEESSSLSAILLDDDYYSFTLSNISVVDDLPHANEIALICLKAKAFLNNKARKEAGEDVQEDDIIKHKKDVIRLVVTLDPQLKIDAPETIKVDLREYVKVVGEENPDIKQLLKNQGVTDVSLQEVLELITSIFQL